MKYSHLRYKPLLEYLLFVLTVGFLAFLSQKNAWLWFAIVFLVAAVISALLTWAASSTFRAGLAKLRASEFELASRFGQVGATGFFLMEDQRQRLERNDLTREILEEGQHFSLATLTAASYIDPGVDRHWPTLKSRLDDGCTLRLLLQNPFSAEQRVRNARNGLDLPHDHKMNLSALLNLAAAYPRVEIRFADANIYCAVFFSERRLTYDAYHLGKIGERLENRFFTIAYERPQGGARAGGALDHYSLLVSHFDYLWSSLSIDLVEFLVAHSEDIEASVGAATSNHAKRFLAKR